MKSLLKYFLIILSVVTLIYILFPTVMMIVIYGWMSIENNRQYMKSFEQTYIERDYNDTAVQLYKQELQNAYLVFLDAKTKVEMFESYVKTDIADDCIAYGLKKYSAGWIPEYQNFRKNARNKAVHGDDALIDRYKEINHKIQLDFYLYDFNLVSNMMDDFTGLHSDKHSLCEDKMKVDKIYTVFLQAYLREYISSYNQTLKREKTHPDKNQNYIKNKIKTEKKWLNEILKTSSNALHKRYVRGEISLEEIQIQNDFDASLSSVDLAYTDNGDFLVADSNRGLELWQKENSKLKYVKTLDDRYRFFIIRKFGNILYTLGSKKGQSTKFLIVYRYDALTQSVKELSSLQVCLSSNKTLQFYNNNKNIALTCFSMNHIYAVDISNPSDIKISKSILVPHYARNVYVYLDTLYYIVDKFYPLNMQAIDDKIKTFRFRNHSWKSSYPTGSLPYNETLSAMKVKKYSAVYIDSKSKNLYGVENLYEKGGYLYKYKIKKNNGLKFVKSIAIENRFNAENMKWHENKLYLFTQKALSIYDKNLNLLKQIEIANIEAFKIIGNDIALATRGGGIQVIYSIF